MKVVDNADEPVGITKQTQAPKTPKTPKPKAKEKTAPQPSQTPPEPAVTPLNPSSVTDVLAPQKELLNAAEQGFWLRANKLLLL